MSARLTAIICALVLAACGSEAGVRGAEPTTTIAATSTSTPLTTTTSTTTVATTLPVPSTTMAPPSIALRPPPAAPPARLDARAIVVLPNEILEFDVSDGSVGRQMFVADEVASGGVSVRRVNGRPEIYVAPRGARPCMGSITRIDDSGAHDLGLSGTMPRPSPDGRQLAYFDAQPTTDLCEGHLVIRELATGRERRWPVGPRYPAVMNPIWGADNRHVHLAGLGGFPPFVALDTVGAPDGIVWDVAAPIDAGLRDGDYVHVLQTVPDGVLVEIRCCTFGPSRYERRGLAVLNGGRLQLIETPIPVEQIRAVDPTASVMVFENDGLFAARIDGTERRRIELPGLLLFY